MAVFIDLNKKNNSTLIFDKAGDYVVFFFNISGKYSFVIDSPMVNVDIYGLFVGKKNDQFYLETVQLHQKPSSSSNILIKGVFYDYAKFNFQGLIRIEKEAQKTHAYQKNQNLLFSPFCFVESKPYLEILANDVFCTHASTSGKMSEQQKFYLLTRKLNIKQAESLLIHGFVNEIFDKMRKQVDINFFKKTFFEVQDFLGLNF